jgi:hypothetical protein
MGSLAGWEGRVTGTIDELDISPRAAERRQRRSAGRQPARRSGRRPARWPSSGRSAIGNTARGRTMDECLRLVAQGVVDLAAKL